MIFYHGTAAVLVPLILKRGLVPHAGKGADAWAIKNRPRLALGAAEETATHPDRKQSVYVAPAIDNAVMFAKLAAIMNNSTPKILEVTISQSELIMDEDAVGAAFRHVGPIAASQIRLLEDEKWSDWQGVPIPGQSLFDMIAGA